MAERQAAPVVVIIVVGALSLIYSLCNPVLYGKMSPRYSRAYKLLVGNVLDICGRRPRSWSTSSISNFYFLILYRIRTWLHGHKTDRFISRLECMKYGECIGLYNPDSS